MGTILLFKGILIGMIMACPFGPIGIIFIQRSLENEKYEGAASGVGIATGDMFYSIMATFGISFLDEFLIKYTIWFKILAFCILLFMALRTMRAKISFSIRDSHQRNLFQAFGISFLLALHNPSSVVIFAFLFGLFRIGEIITFPYAVSLIIGIYIGSSSLWFFLNHLIHYVKKRDKIEYLNTFYRLSGIVLIVLSISVLFSIVRNCLI